MDLQVLHTELVNDPLNLQYSTKTDQECADILNTMNQKKARSQMITFRGLYEAKNLGLQWLLLFLPRYVAGLVLTK